MLFQNNLYNVIMEKLNGESHSVCCTFKNIIQRQFRVSVVHSTSTLTSSAKHNKLIVLKRVKWGGRSVGEKRRL